MDQRNAQALILEALRQSGFGLSSEGNAAHCTEGCAAVHAVETLARMAATQNKPLYDFVLKSIEKPLIEKALARTGGNQVAAARLLGLHRNSLRVRMRALGLKAVRPAGLADDAV